VLAAHDFNYAILNQRAHRPWPMPDAPWVMTQTWHDLLFAHWPIGASRLRSMIPPMFELDLYEGEAWIGVVPFHMTNVGVRGVPALPWLSAFPELNVRTYVRVGDRPGVYFFSLDAARSIAVQAARALFNLPYYTAAMTVSGEGEIVYRSARAGDERARFEATYAPSGPVFTASPGSLDYFLTERYCLYNVSHRARPYRLDIHHPPWPLQCARTELRQNSMAGISGIPLPDCPPVLHFAKRQDMVAWMPASLARTPPDR
jgi:uncharacterized protein YqjF (DUF2071 family)